MILNFWDYRSEHNSYSGDHIQDFVYDEPALLQSSHIPSFNFGAFLSFDFQIKDAQPNMNGEFSFSVGALLDSCCIQWKESSLDLQQAECH